MKVKFLSPAGGKDVSFSAGEEADVDNALGEALVNAGLAESLERNVKQRDQVSTRKGGEKATRSNK